MKLDNFLLGVDLYGNMPSAEGEQRMEIKKISKCALREQSNDIEFEHYVHLT